MRRRSSATCSSASAHRRAPPRAGVLPSSRVGRCSALARERHALSRHSALAQVLRALTRPLAPTRYRPRWERARTGAALQAHAHVYTRPRTFCSSFAGGLGSARLRTRPRSAPLDGPSRDACTRLIGAREIPGICVALETERGPWRLAIRELQRAGSTRGQRGVAAPEVRARCGVGCAGSLDAHTV